MSLYALTAAALKRMGREHYGRKVEVPDKFDPQTGKPVSFTKVDTGVQPPIDELLASLSSIAPIELPSSLKLVAPANAPVFQIFVNGDGDGDGDGTIIIYQIINNFNQTITNIFNDGSITINNIEGDVTNINVDTEGHTGSVQVMSGVSGSVSVNGCTVTLTLTPTYTTLQFSNGLCVGVS